MAIHVYSILDPTWDVVMRNLAVKQGGQCRHCGKEISGDVVSKRKIKTVYYHKDCAKRVMII